MVKIFCSNTNKTLVCSYIHTMNSQNKYSRNLSGSVSVKEKPVRTRRRIEQIKLLDEQYKEAVEAASKTDILLQEEAGFLEAEGMEKTFRFKQDEIVEAVDISTANKRFELNLKEFGPYTIDYTRNGRDLLIAGKKGHVASFDWRLGKLDCELHLNETVNAVKYLHNDQFFAVAQKKYTFIYDKTGMELHRLNQHVGCTHLDFLPYHFLLTTAGTSGILKYHDVSTGTLVSEHRTKLGPTTAMRQNPWNAVMHLGHSNGQVTLWSPSMSNPLVKMQVCRGPIRSLAINRDGRYMSAVGADKTLKIWDIRTFKEIDSYITPTQANTVDISDTGLISVGWGPHITVWKDCFKKKQVDPYMSHLLPGSQVQTSRFVPFEDILGVGHNNGFSSLIIPGAGESNYDALELNPFETTKMRKETEVRMLMNKLKPDMISLDPTVIGTVDKRKPQERLTTKDMNELDITKSNQEKTGDDITKFIRPETKSKNSALRKFKRKQTRNMITERSQRIEKALEKETQLRKEAQDAENGIVEEKDVLDDALSRFK